MRAAGQPVVQVVQVGLGTCRRTGGSGRRSCPGSFMSGAGYRPALHPPSQLPQTESEGEPRLDIREVLTAGGLRAGLTHQPGPGSSTAQLAIAADRSAAARAAAQPCAVPADTIPTPCCLPVARPGG